MEKEGGFRFPIYIQHSHVTQRGILSEKKIPLVFIFIRSNIRASAHPSTPVTINGQKSSRRHTSNTARQKLYGDPCPSMS
ncbi:hypothetical protein QC762_0018120 [Podospora pseudocomata]|uniref:Uncharacterized protein n=1 Tax=Podospora pseudocomata TaxID=2093779 RepID=A0ABR0GXF5_9PEZI|nr:hypothetical protein QC762_0018120 [Podospora pseudocomata]